MTVYPAGLDLVLLWLPCEISYQSQHQSLEHSRLLDTSDVFLFFISQSLRSFLWKRSTAQSLLILIPGDIPASMQQISGMQKVVAKSR
jgi:hypothetical protein